MSASLNSLSRFTDLCLLFFKLHVCIILPYCLVFVVSPSIGITRSIQSSTAESVKEENKTSNPTSSVTSFSVAPTFSLNLTLGPVYVTTVNSSESDNGTTRTASTSSVGTTSSPNGTLLPDTPFADARTEPWEANSSTAATTAETFPPSGQHTVCLLCLLFQFIHPLFSLSFMAIFSEVTKQ